MEHAADRAFPSSNLSIRFPMNRFFPACLLSLISLLAIFAATAWAQSATSSPNQALTTRQQREAQEIAKALIARDSLLDEVDALTVQIGERKSKRNERSELEKVIAREKKKLTDLKATPSPNQGDITVLEGQIQELEASLQRMPKAETLNDEIAALDQEIKGKSSQVSVLLGTLTGQYSGEQSFRQSNSITFAILIGMVILGFFGLAFLDVTVRAAIFGGESGIQFVALFSIIIAIILFGISGILEGKELAALLGGLSGYILGRTSATRSANASTGGTPAGGTPAGGAPPGGTPAR